MSDPLEDFRHDTRAWLEENCPQSMRGPAPVGSTYTGGGRRFPRYAKPEADSRLWLERMAERGFTAPTWPKKYAGGGLTREEERVLTEELKRIDARPALGSIGIMMFGPTILEYGNEEQKQRILPPIVRGEVAWCQGYSEPGAGSDLASLQCRCEDRGDHYVVNGQKTWTTAAQWADMIFCLVRTSTEGKPQEGISFLLIDMRGPGISVQPIVTMDGGHEINDVFFEDVRVPAENLIGEENKGWTYAKFLLSHERSGIAAVGTSKRQIERLKAIAAAEQSDGRPLIEDTRFRDKIATVEIDLMALEYTELRALAAESKGKPPGPEASLLKIKGTEMQQAISELFLEAVGYYANPFIPEALEEGWNEEPIGPDYAAPLAPHYFNWRKASIYGGTNEIQKNIIAKMVLGL